MSTNSHPFTPRKQAVFLWGGAALLAVGAVTALLNLLLDIPDYQKISWLMVGFFLVSGACGVGVAKNALPQRGKVTEYGEALVVAILLAILIRGTVVQAFKIPSGSMLPTLLIGDHLLVSKFLYGVRLPYTGTRLPGFRKPKRGDIAVFAYPADDSKDFIKRVIGEPGDLLEVRNKHIYINGEAIDDPWGVIEQGVGRVRVNGAPVEDPWGAFSGEPVTSGQGGQGANLPPVRVPPGKYFMMGDNRDRSYDSRFWGFVDEARIRGKAFVIYWSWDGERTLPRFGRIGDLIR